MFKVLVGAVVGAVASAITACSSLVSEQTALNAIQGLTTFDSDVQKSAVGSFLVSYSIAGTAKEILIKENSNSVAAIATEENFSGTKPEILVNVYAKRKVIALVCGLTIGIAVGNIAKANTVVALAGAIGVSSISGVKSTAGMILGLGISKIALTLLGGMTASPISALVIGLFFLPTQICTFLFGKKKPKVISINENVSKFSISSMKDAFNIASPALSTGDAIITNSFIEAVGLGASSQMGSTMINKSLIQALIPEIDFNVIIASILGVLITIPFLGKIFQSVIKMTFWNKNLLTMVGILVNVVTLLLLIGGFNTLILVALGIICKLIIPAKIMQVVFFGGMF